MQFPLQEYSRSTRFQIFLGAAIVLLLFIFAGFADFISPFPPNRIVSEMLQPPSSSHVMGTDTLGRDVFSRLLHGARYSLYVSSISVVIGVSVGTLAGVLSGYLGGPVDQIMTVLSDTLWAFPLYVMAIMFVIAFGITITSIAVAVAITYIPQYFRVVRSITLSIKEREFVNSVRLLGASRMHIVVHHILPYTVSSVAVLASLAVADSVLTVSGLGFLGLGIQPPTPEWGTDLRFARDYIPSGIWWPAVFPGIMIFLTVLGFNLLSEGLNSITVEKYGELK